MKAIYWLRIDEQSEARVRRINKLIGSLAFSGQILKRRLYSKQRKEIPILGYHKVNDQCELDVLSVPAKLFKEQMLFLAKRGYTTLCLDDLPLYYAGKLPLPNKPVVITFDDGHKDNYTYVYPVLKKYGFTATIFLISRLMGKEAIWEEANKREETHPLLSWEEAREMSQDGITFGSHTCTHPHLTEVSPEQARCEITESKREIESGLKRPVNFFCYPFGDFNEQIRQMVKEAGYLGACTVSVGLNEVGDDLYSLKRIMHFFDEANLLEGALIGAFNFLKYEDRIKKWLKERY